MPGDHVQVAIGRSHRPLFHDPPTPSKRGREWTVTFTMHPIIALGRFAKCPGDARLMAEDIKTLEWYRLPQPTLFLCAHSSLWTAPSDKTHCHIRFDYGIQSSRCAYPRTKWGSFRVPPGSLHLCTVLHRIHSSRCRASWPLTLPRRRILTCHDDRSSRSSSALTSSLFT